MRFIASSVSGLLDTLSERICNCKCKDCKSCVKYVDVKYNLLILNCLKCNKNHKKYLKENFVKRFAKAYKFCDGDITKNFCLMLRKFCLMLRKGVYPCKYMDSWERFNEISFPDKKELYSSLNIEGITGEDYEHAEKEYVKISN